LEIKLKIWLKKVLKRSRRRSWEVQAYRILYY
jgi:hypothetical protein